MTAKDLLFDTDGAVQLPATATWHRMSREERFEYVALVLVDSIERSARPLSARIEHGMKVLLSLLDPDDLAKVREQRLTATERQVAARRRVLATEIVATEAKLAGLRRDLAQVGTSAENPSGDGAGT
jgi:hypothetical protein